MEEKKNFIINTLYWGIVVGLGYLFFKYVCSPALPFIFAFILAYFAVKITKKIFKKDNKIVRIISLVVIYIIILVIATFLISLGVNEIVDFFSLLPKFYTNTVEPIIAAGKNNIDNLAKTMPKEIAKYIVSFSEDVLNTISSLVLTLSKTLVSVATSIVTSAPDFIISLFALIISSFYFVFDYEKVKHFCGSFFSEKIIGYYFEVKDFISNKLLKILGSYLIIMGITFVELLLGLLLFKVDNAVILSLIISLLDILPVLGVGTVLIPWGIICLVIGKVNLGIELLALYLVITVIRNIIEPKLVGGDLGLHPLLTLISMIIGLDLFGVVGLFGFPLIISFFINRKDSESYKTNKKAETKKKISAKTNKTAK